MTLINQIKTVIMSQYHDVAQGLTADNYLLNEKTN